MALNESEMEELTVALQIVGGLIDSYEQIPKRCRHRFLADGEIPQRAVELRDLAVKLVARVIATGRV